MCNVPNLAKMFQTKAPEVNIPTLNLDQNINTDQFRGGSFEAANKSVTDVTGGEVAVNRAPDQPDMSAVDAIFTGTDEALRQTGTYLTRDLPNFLRNPAEQLGLNRDMGPIFGASGGDGGDGSGDGNGTGTPDSSTEDSTVMTAAEKRNKIRQLMASRYGKRETILTGGTGIGEFGV